MHALVQRVRIATTSGHECGSGSVRYMRPGVQARRDREGIGRRREAIARP